VIGWISDILRVEEGGLVTIWGAMACKGVWFKKIGKDEADAFVAAEVGHDKIKRTKRGIILSITNR